MPGYTNVAKPTGTPYTNVSKAGSVTYDEPTIAYDDASTFYDGIGQASYTNISKPQPTLTWAQATFSWASATFPWESAVGYTNISKPV